MQAKTKLLIDTDIGDNLDDAFAIFAAMALDFEIVGITTVFRNTVDRARMTKKLLKSFGKDYGSVPVYAGFSGNGAGENSEYLSCFEADLAMEAYAPENTDPEAAADFIIDCCHRYGKDLTVVALGPFCNIAKVIEKDPNALSCAKKVVIMGGAYFMQYADWNVMCDVPAADLMFRTLSNLECIGADATHRLADPGYLEKVLRADNCPNAALRYLSELYRQWRQQHDQEALVLHDVLVIYYLYDPSICSMQPILTAVITEGLAKGLTLNISSYGKTYLNSIYQERSPGTPVLVAGDVDIERFHSFVQRDISS